MSHLERCCFSSLLTCWMVAEVLFFSRFSEIKPGDGVKNRAERWARRLGFRIVSFREHIPDSYALTFFLFWECCGVLTVTEPPAGLITDEWWRCWHFLITELFLPPEGPVRIRAAERIPAVGEGCGPDTQKWLGCHRNTVIWTKSVWQLCSCGEMSNMSNNHWDVSKVTELFFYF